MKINVGELRAQTAYLDSNVKVELVSNDPEVQDILPTLCIVEFFPDTAGADGKVPGTFKIKLGKQWAPSAVDRRRLNDGMQALLLPEPGADSTVEEVNNFLAMLHMAIAALQSLDDLGEEENRKAMKS